jgi:pilus assembly protein Flp/PilA
MAHQTIGGKTEMEKVRNFLADESGATAVEYGIIIALIAGAIIIALQTLGGGLQSLFNRMGATVQGAG